MTSSGSSRAPSHYDKDATEESKPKVKAELPYLFEKELTVKQNKRIYIVNEFVATERVTPIEGKFYSKFNDAETKKLNQRQCFWELAERRRNESRMKQGFPLLESQTYGWMPDSISTLALKQINYIQAPKRPSTLTIYGEKLFCEQVTERPKFTGERFYLR